MSHICHGHHHNHHHHHHHTSKKSRRHKIGRHEEEEKVQNFVSKCCQYCDGEKESISQKSRPPPAVHHGNSGSRSNYSPVNYVHGPCHDVDMVHWVNGMLRSNYGRIEELASGTAYCQLMDMLFPGSLSLKKVKFQTLTEKERVENLLILRTAFEKVFVDNRVVPIDKLSEGNRQANLELLSWFRTLFSLNSEDLPPPKFSNANEIPVCQVPFCRGASMNRPIYQLPPPPLEPTPPVMRSSCAHSQPAVCHSHCCAH